MIMYISIILKMGAGKAEVKMPHLQHEEHLCLLQNMGTNL
jgi:hypothetical protein